ncbi:MAG: anti-sigma factor antagonist [Anaerolineaceae bacterium]|jgi:anti-anti-sigma regulatory factor|nr:MAG: anti-sigma factor antagonist [Anaerolineaceae bacterium]
MQISFSRRDGGVPVTIMQIAGDVDASNYTDVINKAQEAYDDGARYLLIDMERVPYISSAGLMALHTVARIFTGQPAQAREGGRPSFRAIDPQKDASAREHVKLLSPQSAVEQVLDVIGLNKALDIHTDLEAAVNSFG